LDTLCKTDLTLIFQQVQYQHTKHKMNLPLVPHQLFHPSLLPPFALTPPSPTASLEVCSNGRAEEAKLRVLVQPNDVQVKRVGRASCIEPDIKLCVEMDTQYPRTIAVNAYLKVLGKDNKHKLILLRKSDDITFTKTHKREIICMKLRFLKTIKVQVLKRNLGVSRPEASIVFEAVGSKLNEFEGACSTNHFAIISDPRYLDEVKHRRASERNEPYQLSDDEYHPQGAVRRIKRRRIDRPKFLTTDDDVTSPEVDEEYHPQHTPLLPHIEDAPYEDMAISPPLPSPSTPPSPFTPPPSDALQALKECADYELFTDRKEEQMRLIKLVEALKHKGCNFRILPPRSQFY